MYNRSRKLGTLTYQRPKNNSEQTQLSPFGFPKKIRLNRLNLFRNWCNSPTKKPRTHNDSVESARGHTVILGVTAVVTQMLQEKRTQFATSFCLCPSHATADSPYFYVFLALTPRVSKQFTYPVIKDFWRRDLTPGSESNTSIEVQLYDIFVSFDIIYTYMIYIYMYIHDT